MSAFTLEMLKLYSTGLMHLYITKDTCNIDNLAAFTSLSTITVNAYNCLHGIFSNVCNVPWCISITCLIRVLSIALILLAA